MRRIAASPSRFDRVWPLGFIVLLHIGFFHALQSGLPHKAASQPAPKEVVATFFTPEPAREAPRPQPATPKSVPVVQKAAPAAKKPAPAVHKPATVPAAAAAPAPNAISVPPAAAAPEPAAPAAAPATAATSTAPAAPAQPKTIASGVEYLQPPDPKYPPAARRMGEEGRAVLRVLVNDKGRAERIELQKSSGSPRLDDAAKQAVQQALFKPHVEDGKAVAVFAIVPINFQLSD